jgi:hypothetical protein
MDSSPTYTSPTKKPVPMMLSGGGSGTGGAQSQPDHANAANVADSATQRTSPPITRFMHPPREVRRHLSGDSEPGDCDLDAR